MHTKHTTPHQKVVARKTSRLAKISHHIPVGGIITIKGKTTAQIKKSFHFKVLSAAQQMKERNKVYTFFSID